MPRKKRNLAQRSNSIKLIQWSNSSTERRSQARLVQEYLRRSALWTLELRTGPWPFYDIADRINPDIRAPEPLVDEVIESMSGAGNYFVLHTVKWSLHFAALKDHGLDTTKIPDPFTPLLLMYARGGMVNRDSTGFIEVDGVSFRLGGVEKAATKKPLASLDEKTLQEIDEKGWPDRAAQPPQR
jgi:hypothetical protein